MALNYVGYRLRVQLIDATLYSYKLRRSVDNEIQKTYSLQRGTKIPDVGSMAKRRVAVFNCQAVPQAADLPVSGEDVHHAVDKV